MRRWRRPAPPLASGQGHAVIDGVFCAIVDVRLTECEFQILIRVAGPCHLEGPITVFGRDGRGVFQGQNVPPRDIPSGEFADVLLHIQALSLVDGEPMRWST